MSQSQPKKNSRKPALAAGTKVRFEGLDGYVQRERRPKFAKRYAVAVPALGAVVNMRRDQFEVAG